MPITVATTNVLTGETVTGEMSAEEESAIATYAADVAPERLRQTRDRLLAETDVYALSDRTLSDEMRTYRQALRDLPANTSDPQNPTWPTKPSS